MTRRRHTARTKGRCFHPAAFLVAASLALSGCTVVSVAATAVDVATDVVVTTVDLTTDLVGTGVEMATNVDEDADTASAPASQQASLPARKNRPTAGTPRHGNWCGVERQSADPTRAIDRVDGFCRDHTICIAEGIPALDCDAVLVRRLNLILADVDPIQRAAAASLIAYFE